MQRSIRDLFKGSQVLGGRPVRRRTANRPIVLAGQLRPGSAEFVKT